MASKTRASRPAGTGISLSMTASTSRAVSPRACSKPILIPGASLKRNRLRFKGTVRLDYDLVDPGLRFAQFRLAMALQQRSALVSGNGFVELAAAGLEPAHDLLQF